MDNKDYLEIEKTILAILLNDANKRSLIFSKISYEDFLDSSNSLIFKSIFNLINSNNINKKEYNQIPPLILFPELESLKGNELVSLNYLKEVDAFFTDSWYVDELLDVIRERSDKQKLKAIFKNINSDLDTRKPVNDIIEDLFLQTNTFFDIVSSNNFIKLKELEMKAIEKIEKIRNGEISTGISSGFDKIDEFTAGFRPGELIILAARPSMGKTALALNIAYNVVTNKKNIKHKKNGIVFFSLEMPNEQLVLRILSSKTNIPLFKIRTNVNANDFNLLKLNIEKEEDISFYLDDSNLISLFELEKKLITLTKVDPNIGLIIIDYLQLLKVDNRKRDSLIHSRQEEVSIISRNLKLLAKKLNIPILCLSQLSRAVEKRDSKKPLLSDLRESGSIEQDADIVMMLYRDSYYNKLAKDDNLNNIDDLITKSSNSKTHKLIKDKVEVLFAKNRNGPIGNLDISFIKETGKFIEKV